MKTIIRFPSLSFHRMILILSVLTLSFIGAECDKLLDPQFGDDDIDGTWELVGMQGNLQDVCLGEIATFNTNTNNATLRCPNEASITRPFTFTGTTLTYTNTGIRYSVSFNTLSNGINQMKLTGENVDRVLTYNRISN